MCFNKVLNMPVGSVFLTSPHFHPCDGKQYMMYSLVQELRMVPKIFFLLRSSISVKARKLKWRRKRAVTGLRPPPGGPMAHTKFTSTRLRKSPVTDTVILMVITVKQNP